MPENPTPPKRKPRNRPEPAVSFLPEGNPKARLAYILTLIGLVPVLGAFFGPFAFWFGWRGWRAAKTTLAGKGLAHAFVSMLLGVLETILNISGITLIAIDLGWLS